MPRQGSSPRCVALGGARERHLIRVQHLGRSMVPKAEQGTDGRRTGWSGEVWLAVSACCAGQLLRGQSLRKSGGGCTPDGCVEERCRCLPPVTETAAARSTCATAWAPRVAAEWQHQPWPRTHLRSPTPLSGAMHGGRDAGCGSRIRVSAAELPMYPAHKWLQCMGRACRLAKCPR